MMGIGDSEDKKVMDIKLEPWCEVCNNPTVSTKLEDSVSTNIKTDYSRHQDGSNDRNVLNIKLEAVCEVCNNPKISIKLETSGSTSNKTETENVDYDKLKLEDAVNKQPVHQLMSKGM